SGRSSTTPRRRTTAAVRASGSARKELEERHGSLQRTGSQALPPRGREPDRDAEGSALHGGSPVPARPARPAASPQAERLRGAPAREAEAAHLLQHEREAVPQPVRGGLEVRGLDGFGVPAAPGVPARPRRL